MTQSSIQLHKRLQFDLPDGQVMDGPRRYVIMRADVLMGAFDKLDPHTRFKMLASLGDSVTDFGGDSVRSYLAQVGTQALLQTMVDGSASLGWGVWSFRTEEDELLLEVRNSPFAAGSRSAEAPVCQPIVGMLRAIAQALWARPADVAELSCACEKHGGEAPVCRFRARPAMTAPSSSR